MFDWNDLRYFLAVAERGSTLAAGHALRVSQTTVARRIAALEQAVALPLFDRRQAGYALTPAGEQLLSHARTVEAAASGFGDAAAGHARDLSGTVRLTTEDIFAQTLLGPMLRELHDLQPQILIDLDTAQAIRDLGAGEADIALRSTKLAQPAGIVGRRLCVDDWTLYCSRDYAARHGVPKNVEQLKSHALVGGGGGNLWRAYEAWIQELGLEEQVAIHHGSSTGLLSAVRSGFGIAVLPCIVADDEPDLIRCLPPRRGHGRVMWLLTHERVRHAPRVRVVIDFLYERLKRRVSDLSLAT
ncbi:MAG: LysR family transcriptional regulator [Pseudomonadota bacterium]|nr:LysR family transcriptional regulator [Pseudomonadota bacterium]